MFTPPPATNVPADPVVSVSTLNRQARECLEARFPLLWVAGEISNLTRAASGHFYFSLKDDVAQVRCVMFRNRAQLLPFQLSNGMQVEARSLVSLYEPRGDFQLSVEGLRRAGLGALYEAYGRLRERLAGEGLFDPARKRALPRFPRRLAVLTSLQAAALRDVLAALRRRAPHVPVEVHPVPVQGNGAAEQIAAAVRRVGNEGRCDAMLLVRGGGSIEDLWAFNDEALARVIASSPVPVVTGVGHESDFTIADFVADLRAATPTAAAEMASAGFAEAGAALGRLRLALQRSMRDALQLRMQRVDRCGSRLLHPAQRLAHARLTLQHLGSRLAAAYRHSQSDRRQEIARLHRSLAARRPATGALAAQLQAEAARLRGALRTRLAQHRARLERLGSNLGHLNPEAILGRGYSIVRDAQSRILCSDRTLSPGDRVTIQFAEGRVAAQVTDKKGESALS